ncbi:MAG: TonB-dependent receptor [Rikenellaceae bacterium]|nr:TonB-dependent receptor [Rikenellaceae bacterium]
MKSIYMGILIVFLLPGILSAQTPRRQNIDANITGHVVKSGSHDHLPYISIAVNGTTIGTVTDATGHYFLKNLPEGEIVLTASSIGYKPQEKTVTITPNTTFEINFELEEAAVMMDAVVVTASRNETDKKSASTIVNVMSTQIFERTSSNNLTETLNFQPGLRVENSCSNCGTTQLRINGLDGQYSQILIDSRPVFSSLAAVYGLEQLPVSMVERIEVIRGGGSALFGANAIGGVVNIITKEPLRNSVSVSNNTGVTDKNTWDVNTAFNGSFVSDDYRAGIHLFGIIRDRNPYDRNGDGFSEIPKISLETIGFRGYYKLSNYSKLTAEYHHIHEFRRGGDNFGNPPHEAEIAEQLDHKIDGGGITYSWNTADYRHRLNLYSSAQKVDRDSYFGTQMNPDAYGNTKDLTFVAGSQYTILFDNVIFSPSDFTVGVEFTHNDLHDRILGYGRDFKQNTNIIGGYFQNEWSTDKYSVLIGGRLDKHNMMKNAVFNPRANVRYSPSEYAGFRVSYSSGYRAPQAYDEDLHVDAVGGEVTIIELDPDLKPEYSHSISASADLYKNFGSWQTNLLIEGFYTILNDVFTLVQNGEDAQGNLLLLRENASGATVKGVNLELRAALPGLVDIQAGYTFQKSRYKDPFRWSEDENLPAQKTMFRSPDHYGYMTANFNITKNFDASLFSNYTGSMLVQHNTGYIEEDTEKKTRGFIDIGIRFAYTFRLSGFCDIELNAGIKNIFDQFQKDIDRGPFKDAGYVYGPSFPRMYFFGVKFSL